jgi:serine/threonine protein phosphatase PrpC
LSKSLPEERLAELLAGDQETGVERLMAAALAAHAIDNVTVVTVEFDANGRSTFVDADSSTVGTENGHQARSTPEAA